MRLIDADALHEALMTKQKWVVRCGDKHNEGYTYDQVHFAIDEAPTIEAVSIDDYRSMENTCYKLQKALYEMTDRKTEPTISKMEQVDKPKICDTCRYYNSNIPCGSTPSACKEADKFAEEFVDGLKKLKPKDEPTISKMEQVEDEPQTEEPTMDEYYKDHDEFYDCDRYVITNDEGERAYNCIGCQTDCPWK